MVQPASSLRCLAWEPSSLLLLGLVCAGTGVSEAFVRNGGGVCVVARGGAATVPASAAGPVWRFWGGAYQYLVVPSVAGGMCVGDRGLVASLGW